MQIILGRNSKECDNKLVDIFILYKIYEWWYENTIDPITKTWPDISEYGSKPVGNKLSIYLRLKNQIITTKSIHPLKHWKN